MREELSQDHVALSGRARSGAWQRGRSSLLGSAAFLSFLSCGSAPCDFPSRSHEVDWEFYKP